MKKITPLIILKIITLFMTSILIFLIAFFQYTGVGVLSQANNQYKIEDFIISDSTENKEVTNPETSIKNTPGIRVQLNGLKNTINVLEIDAEIIEAEEIEAEDMSSNKIMGRIYYSADGQFTTPNSVVLNMREGKNYLSLNKNNLRELYFAFPLDKIKVNAITINQHYSILEVIGNSLPIISINLLILLLCFFILDSKLIFGQNKLFSGDKILWIVMLFYYNKFFIIMDGSLYSYAIGFIFLLIMVLVFIFLRIISKENTGEISE